MKVLGKALEKDGRGWMRLAAEDTTDVWQIYNVIRQGDIVKTKTFRRITKERDDSSGAVTASGGGSSERVSVVLAVTVEKTEYDSTTGTMNVAGIVAEENSAARVGAHHTVEIAITRPVTIIKHIEPWDSQMLEAIARAADIKSKADVGAVVLEPGRASICLVTGEVTSVRQRIETSIPRKSQATDNALDKFYRNTAAAIVRAFDFDALRVIILASPGFAAERLRHTIIDTASRQTDDKAAKVILKNKSKIIVVKCASGHVHSLNEALRAPEVRARLADVKFVREAAVLDEFFVALGKDSSKAIYGRNHVLAAAGLGAIRTLLITDGLMGRSIAVIRKEYVGLVEHVRAVGGEALVYSSAHETGRQLDQFTGIAAILSYAIDLDDIEDDDDSDQE
ncbi:hypothetical protein V1511DRAFT_504897 [Dipodascopsis uninucleata]